MSYDLLDNLISLINSPSVAECLIKGTDDKRKLKIKDVSNDHQSHQQANKHNQDEPHFLEGDEQSQQVDPIALDNFSSLYQHRLERIEHKNQKIIKQAKRKQQIKDKMAQQLLQQQKQLQLQQQKDLMVNMHATNNLSIRYLIFRPWSGKNHSRLIDNSSQILDESVKSFPMSQKAPNNTGYCYRFPSGVAPLIKHLLDENGFTQTTNNDGSIIWHVGVVPPTIYQSMGAYQKINHFPKSFQITRKDLMLQNLSKMKSKHPTQYNFFPKTYILPAETPQFIDDTQKHHGRVNDKWYIVKPSNSSQGKGIWLSNKPDEILKRQKECIVVCEYIHNPLLVNGLKFDVRLYVGITCFNPLRLYLYEDGLTRFATSAYSFDLSSQQNVFAHLTNYSLNKFSENFVVNDDQDGCVGHKWSLRALREYLRQQNIDVDILWSRIEDLIIKTMISIENTVFSAMQLTVPYRDNCFQVLGFDVLIDSNLKPWLLQVNLSPSLNTDSNLDLKIKGAMIAQLFTLMGVVSPQQRFGEDKTYMVNNNKAIAQNKNDMGRLEKIVLRETQEEGKRQLLSVTEG